jgi:hypothetical protein
MDKEVKKLREQKLREWKIRNLADIGEERDQLCYQYATKMAVFVERENEIKKKTFLPREEGSSRY